MILEVDIDYNKFYSNKDIIINEFITIKHPTMGEILDIGEENFYQNIEIFITRPYDHLVSLFESGYSFLDINQYEFFINLFSVCSKDRYSWVLGNYDFEILKDDKNKLFLYNKENDLFIDEYLYYQIHKYLCVMLNIPDVTAKPGNKQALKMLVRMKKRQQKKQTILNKRSVFSNYIGSLLSCGFDYKEIYEMRIFNVIETVNRIRLRDNLNNVIYGMYSGNINPKDINLDNYEWVYLK